MEFNTDLSGEYEKLWATIELRPSMAKECNWGAAKVLEGRSRYEAVSAKTGVPWYVIGLLHLMEAGARFDRHMHNGDPLTAKTVQVPKGRPKVWEAPYEWEISAVDAVQYDGLDKVVDWSLPRIAYCFEKYNGWGYRKYHPAVCNPYLWSGSAHYAKGKYVEDGRWDPECASKQVGAMVVLKKLCEMVPEIGFGPSPVAQPEAPKAPAVTTPASFPKAQPSPVKDALGGRTILGQLFAGLGLVVTYLGTALDNVTQVLLDSVAQVTKLEPVAKLSPGSKAIGAGIIALGIVTAIYARIDAARKGKVG